LLLSTLRFTFVGCQILQASEVVTLHKLSHGQSQTDQRQALRSVLYIVYLERNKQQER